MSKLMKWSGSKESQSKKILELFPEEIETYYEPFLGGGSVFLNLLESNKDVTKYILSDLNKELIGVYNLIKENPDLLIKTYINHHLEFNSSDINYRKKYFDYVKKEFNLTKKPEDFYFIMRTTTNGMPRYNRKGEFNNSCHFSRGGMKPNEVEEIIFYYNDLFNTNNVIFTNNSYDILNPDINDLLYLDPPYENTKGMYFGGFNNQEFITWLNNIDSKWVLSYDGKVNDDVIKHNKPNYKEHIYLNSGNSSFRRVIGKDKNAIVKESLYKNY